MKINNFDILGFKNSLLNFNAEISKKREYLAGIDIYSIGNENIQNKIENEIQIITSQLNYLENLKATNDFIRDKISDNNMLFYTQSISIYDLIKNLDEIETRIKILNDNLLYQYDIKRKFNDNEINEQEYNIISNNNWHDFENDINIPLIIGSSILIYFLYKIFIA
jgi:hypothetical protein